MPSLMLLVPLAQAAPTRAPPPRPAQVVWSWGRADDLVVVKLEEGSQAAVLADLGALPLFSTPPHVLRAERATWDPERRLADLTLYGHIRTGPGQAAALATALNRDPRVELAYLAPVPVPPPEDLDPVTPDLTGEQGWAGPAPVGVGGQEALRWPGGRGENVAVADLEYAWDDTHEDLEATVGALTWGVAEPVYDYHGTGVLGMLFAGDNGYGVTGMVPDAEPLVVYPFVDSQTYSLPAAVEAAASLLDAGDVLLIEQQIVANGTYAPVSADPATFDAIALAVAKGIVVVEPAANGSQDLDDPAWLGWFDRDVRDCGSILVGGGASPTGWAPAREWPLGGSSFGSRVDVQGWYDSIATTMNLGLGSGFTDLFLGDGDPRQGYTSQFGGTSGAAPMVAGVAAILQSVSVALHGRPLDPLDLRALLVSTGTPQPPQSEHIGPLPDLRRALNALP